MSSPSNWKYTTQYTMTACNPYKNFERYAREYADAIRGAREVVEQKLTNIERKLKEAREENRILLEEIEEKEEKIEELEQRNEALEQRIAHIKNEEFAEDWTSEMLKKAKEEE